MDEHERQRRLIELHKAPLWEEAKGKLRALVALDGQHIRGSDRWDSAQESGKAVEAFIADFELNGFHE